MPDEDIATAMLLGCEFHRCTPNQHDDRWVVVAGGLVHPIERLHKSRHGTYAFESRGYLAREYIKWALNNKSLDETQG